MSAPAENPFAGQGSVLLDIGDEIGALVVAMPANMEGEEVEIRPLHALPPLEHGHHHEGGHMHHPHVAVVNRPVVGARSPPSSSPKSWRGDTACTSRSPTTARSLSGSSAARSRPRSGPAETTGRRHRPGWRHPVQPLIGNEWCSWATTQQPCSRRRPRVSRNRLAGASRSPSGVLQRSKACA